MLTEDIAYKSVLEFLKCNVSVDLSLAYDKSKIKTRRQLQHIFGHKFGDSRAQTLYELIMTHVAQSEKKCATAGQILLQKLTGNCITYPELRTKEDVLQNLKDQGISDFFVEIMHTLFEHATLDTKVTLKKSTNSNFYLELILGHTFEVTTLLQNSSQKEFINPHLVCIDGYVESVGEIHQLLELYSASRSPLMLFTRGMHDDVLNTLAVNMSRGTLNIHPFKVNFDIDNVNTLVDIANVCGGDIVSSTKGDVISTCIKNVMYADKVSIQSKTVTISAKSNASHSERMKQKINERPELADILKKRLQSLTARQIVIGIPDDINFFSNSQQLDTAIRLFSSLSTGIQPIAVANEYFESLQLAISNTSLI